MCPFQMAPCPFENLGRTLTPEIIKQNHYKKYGRKHRPTSYYFDAKLEVRPTLRNMPLEISRYSTQYQNDTSVILYISTASTNSDSNLLAIQLNSVNLPAACQNHVTVIFKKAYLNLHGRQKSICSESNIPGMPEM